MRKRTTRLLWGSLVAAGILATSTVAVSAFATPSENSPSLGSYQKPVGGEQMYWYSTDIGDVQCLTFYDNSGGDIPTCDWSTLSDSGTYTDGKTKHLLGHYRSINGFSTPVFCLSTFVSVGGFSTDECYFEGAMRN